MRHTPPHPPEPLTGSHAVGDAMHERVVARSPSATLHDVASALAEHRIHCVAVVDDAHLTRRNA